MFIIIPLWLATVFMEAILGLAGYLIYLVVWWDNGAAPAKAEEREKCATIAQASIAQEWCEEDKRVDPDQILLTREITKSIRAGKALYKDNDD